MNKKEKTKIINKSWEEGKIKRIANHSYSVPSKFFLFGITPSLLNEVLRHK